MSILFNEQLANWIDSKINYRTLQSFRFDSIDPRFLQGKALHSFENLARLVGCSSALFRTFSHSIPRHLTFLHMFFNSIDDLASLLDFNAQQLRSLGIGIRCNPNSIAQFSSLFEKYQWKKLIQFNLNLQGRKSFHFESR